jgi:peptidoglycan/LPS O-acetylase OafA/YrhL
MDSSGVVGGRHVRTHADSGGLRRRIAILLGMPVKTSAAIPQKLAYRSDIDGLRAVAVLSVVGYHTAFWRMPGGFVGVDVFFVISGFLISSLIFEEVRRNRFSIAEFYSRRVRRILPALLLILAAVEVMGWWMMRPLALRSLAQMALGGSFFVPNLMVWLQTGYFYDVNARPLIHLWSLGIEEQFYLLWPPIILIFWRKRFGLILGSIAALSLLADLWLVRHHQPVDYFFPFTRFWELMAGAALAWRERGPIDKALGAENGAPLWLRNIFAAVGLIILLGCDFVLEPGGGFPGWPALFPVGATLLMIAAGPDAWINKRLLAAPIAVFFGLISYPLYLWHWPVLSYLWIAEPAGLGGRAKAAAILASIVLAWATYRFLEMPIRSLRDPGEKRRAAHALLCLSAAPVIASIAILLTRP